MALTPEQSKQIKTQLLKQVDKLPQENKEQIKKHIQELNEEQLEEFLKQNKIDISKSQQQTQSKCIFCSIINNETPSYKIAENKNAIAILEINPLSKGHVLIIPLEHTTLDKLSKSTLTLAQKLAKKIKTKLKPEDVKIETSAFQGHAMINVIPFYKNEKIEKKKASEKELKKLQNKLETKKRAKRIIKPKTIIISKFQEISFRVP